MTAHEFWVASGHLLLDVGPDGRLAVTDDFLRAYLARPELLPPPEACAEERALHAELFADPFAPIDASAVADPDARENWAQFATLRDTLLAEGSVEAAYLAAPALPAVMQDQLVHVILRNALDGLHDPLLARAAELFFRAQKVATHAGRALLADQEVIEGLEAARQSSPLLSMLAGAAITELEVINQENGASYWAQSDAHAMAIDLADLRPALGRAIRLWIWHLLGVAVTVEPVARIEDRDWRWFIGLDAAGTRVGNALWEAGGEAPPLLALYRLDLPDTADVVAAARGAPVYLLLAGEADGVVRMKPQNLLFGLPLAALS